MRYRIFLVGLVRIYKNITSGPLYPLFGISTHVSAADEEKTRNVRNVKNDLRVVFYLASPLISFGKKRPSGRILFFGFFVRSGDLDLANTVDSHVYHVGLGGFYYSRHTPKDFPNILYLEIVKSGNQASRNEGTQRYWGFSLRCLAI